MLSGFYTAASGMLMQQRNLNVISNNIANIKTPGFKTERVVSTTFEQALITRQEGNKSQIIGGSTPIRVLEDVPTAFDPSFLEETGRSLDLAINSEGFFNIQGEDRNYLTRNGSFQIDEEGFLVLQGAGRVLSDKGPLKVMTSDFNIDQDGLVTNQKNRKIGSLLITQPPYNQLQKFSNGLFVLDDDENNTVNQEAKIRQGSLETSNIDMNRELTQIMEAQRSLQSCSTLLKGLDQINALTASEIAKL